MELAAGWLAAAVGTVAFFGAIVLSVWIDARKKTRERELAHTERMRALELGQPLPDAEVARAGAEANRFWALSLVGFLVPVCLVGSAVGGTALVFNQAESGLHLPLLAIIWGVCGVISLVTVTTSLGALSRRGSALREEGGHLSPTGRPREARPTGIQEEFPSAQARTVREKESS